MMAEQACVFFDWTLVTKDGVELFQLDEKTLLCMTSYKRHIVGKIHYQDGLLVSTTQGVLDWVVNHRKKNCRLICED